jgi:hypothetical protein
VQREVAALRASGAASAPAAARGPVRARPAPPRRAATATALRRGLGAWRLRLGLGPVPADGAALEALVGRYGTVALAVLLLLMGLGAFLTWAIANVSISPAARVGLGALGGGALAAAGVALRARADAEGSGRAVSATCCSPLALAAVHVDAWGAGPALGLVPPAVSLAVAAWRRRRSRSWRGARATRRCSSPAWAGRCWRRS